jgi:hypothetical protein
MGLNIRNRDRARKFIVDEGQAPLIIDKYGNR